MSDQVCPRDCDVNWWRPKRLLNIGGESNDPFYHYKMPRLIARHEGRGGGIKTAVTNICDISRALNRDPCYITKFFGYELGALSKFDPRAQKSIVYGWHSESVLQDLLTNFIRIYILCPQCRLPELSMRVKASLTAECFACGWNGHIGVGHKLSTYILKHHPTRRSPKKRKSKLSTTEKNWGEHGEVENVLFLGACWTGKSTWFRKTIELFGYFDYFQYDLQHVFVHIENNIVECILRLIGCVSPQDVNPENRYSVTHCKTLMYDATSHHLTDVDFLHIKNLWNDPACQKIVKTADVSVRHPEIIDATKSFIRRLDEISDPEYKVSSEDVARCRLSTEGTDREVLKVDGFTYLLTDVGGSRRHRMNWSRCFEDPHNIIFLANVSGFNGITFEDCTTNRLLEGLKLFETLCNSIHSEDAEIFLLLNFDELFREKLVTGSLKAFVQDLNLRHSLHSPNLLRLANSICRDEDDMTPQQKYNIGGKFIETLFKEKSDNEKLWIFWTDAIDEDCVRFTMSSIFDILHPNPEKWQNTLEIFEECVMEHFVHWPTVLTKEVMLMVSYYTPTTPSVVKFNAENVAGSVAF